MRDVLRWRALATIVMLTAAVLGADGVNARGGRALDLDARAQPISRDALARLMSTRKDLLLFDVRDAPDFQVSHLLAARRIASDTPKEAFAEAIGPSARGRIVVFYCTIGSRSEVFASAVLHALAEYDAQAVYLSGGLLGWRNARMPIYSSRGPTRDVHPQNAANAGLFYDQRHIRYAPR